MTLNVGIF